VGSCSSTPAAAGTITVIATTPPYAASTKTWTWGSQTWSDAIRVPSGCNKSNFTISNTNADCRTYTPGTNTYYYYNWPYVSLYASTLCPSPWRVPTSSDINTLMATNVTRLQIYNAWGVGGAINGVDASYYAIDRDGRWWTITTSGSVNAYRFAYNTGEWNNDVDGKSTGNQVRCVKD
jgi:hypothetical protein